MKVSTLVTCILELFRKHDIPIISAVEVHARLGQPGFYVFDSNLPSQWQQGYIPGAIFLGMEDYDPGLLPADKDATLVFYCYRPICTASHMSAKWARSLGYRRVFVLRDGTKGWVDANFPLAHAGGGETSQEGDFSQSST
jgi:rhodanese-related sulfurtransferase